MPPPFRRWRSPAVEPGHRPRCKPSFEKGLGGPGTWGQPIRYLCALCHGPEWLRVFGKGIGAAACSGRDLVGLQA